MLRPGFFLLTVLSWVSDSPALSGSPWGGEKFQREGDAWARMLDQEGLSHSAASSLGVDGDRSQVWPLKGLGMLVMGNLDVNCFSVSALFCLRPPAPSGGGLCTHLRDLFRAQYSTGQV